MVIILITIDGERKNTAKKVIAERKVTIPVLLLLKEKVMEQYGVRGWIPQIYLVDQEGMLVGKIMGQRNWAGTDTWPCIKEIFNLQ